VPAPRSRNGIPGLASNARQGMSVAYGLLKALKVAAIAKLCFKGFATV
jgi:hypothetical protein